MFLFKITTHLQKLQDHYLAIYFDPFSAAPTLSSEVGKRQQLSSCGFCCATAWGASVGNFRMCVEYVYTRAQYVNCACSSSVCVQNERKRSQGLHQGCKPPYLPCWQTDPSFPRGHHAHLLSMAWVSYILSYQCPWHKACIMIYSARDWVVFQAVPCSVSWHPDTDAENNRKKERVCATAGR